jgi:hypothetical protein
MIIHKHQIDYYFINYKKYKIINNIINNLI